MTMTTQAETIGLPSTSPERSLSRFASIRLGDFPVIPALILASIALVAIFANLLAPPNPEIGSLTARFRPPFWQTGGDTTDHPRPHQQVRPARSRLSLAARAPGAA